jgi:hypothetical protein
MFGSKSDAISCSHLKTIPNVYAQDTLTADAVEGFLRQNEINILVENGGTCSYITFSPGIARISSNASFFSCNPTR